MRLEGVDEFLDLLARLAPETAYPSEFGARAFKIARDDKGNRLTWMKITGGTLQAKSTLKGADGVWEEKADQIRIYTGAKFETVKEMSAGGICAVTGLTKSRAGDGFGFETSRADSALEPAFRYQVFSDDPHKTLTALRQLEEEEPALRVAASGDSIHVRLMGEIQSEILRRRMTGNHSAIDTDPIF